MSTLQHHLPAAVTFRVERSRLLGSDELDGGAELARQVCRDATRRLRLVTVDHESLRRVDGWANDAGFVVHAGAGDAAAPGTATDRDRAVDSLVALLATMLGGLPIEAPEVGVAPVIIGSVAELRPGTLPADMSAVAVLVHDGPGDGLVVGVGDGLRAGALDHGGGGCSLRAVSVAELSRRVAGLLDAAPPRLSDLLASG